MRASSILRITAHRPWPLPTQPWIMRQTWHELLFAHWPVPPAEIQPTLPPGLTLDTFDGQAWIGIVPFRMSDVRPRFVPPPIAMDFPELNVRTYVTAGQKPGVLFYSLDAGNVVAVTLARTLYSLPYYTARFAIRRSGEMVEYAMRRTHRGAPSAAFEAQYRPIGPVFAAPPDSLEHWLTDRFCLYTTSRRGRLLRGEIHHPPWPLQPAEAELALETVSRAAGLTLPDRPPLLHYAHRLEMLAWLVAPVV